MPMGPGVPTNLGCSLLYNEFIVYDNIQFSKKGWVNRNRILVNGKDAYVSLPLRKDSDYLDIVNRSLSDVWKKEKKKLSNRISESYRKFIR